jgi:hypothetical protein
VNTLTTRLDSKMFQQLGEANVNQKTTFLKNLGISHHSNGMGEFGKNQSTSGKASTNRAENIFPKYLLYYVPEIARK